MEELSYITQLTGHTTSISALAINELTVSPPSLGRAHCHYLVPCFSALSTRKGGLPHLIGNISCLCVFCSPSNCATNLLCLRVRLCHVRDRFSTCGPWRASCWLALMLPVGPWQTSCVSASHSDTSGMPGMSLSQAVQMASYGWVPYPQVSSNLMTGLCTDQCGRFFLCISILFFLQFLYTVLSRILLW